MSVNCPTAPTTLPTASNNIVDWHDKILHGDNLPLLKRMPSESVPLIYIDPPFNTGRQQTHKRLKTVAVGKGEQGDRTGFGGKQYKSEVVGETGYSDTFADYLGFLKPRLEEAYRILTPNGSLFFHIDWRESARCRLLLEGIFGGMEHCMNEIIWAYDYGARSNSKWPTKHDNIYWFAKDPKNYIFNYDDIDRVPYMSPELVGKEKAARGKTPTDVWSDDNLINVWWQTIVPTNSKERTGYSTQKPLRIVERIIKTHSNEGDVVLDFFAGSGTTGEAAKKNKRRYIMIDESKKAVLVMKNRTVQRENVELNENKKNKVKSFFDDQMKQMSQGGSFRKQDEKWTGSQYNWILRLAPATMGKVGRDLACKIIERGMSCSVSKKRTGLVVNGKKISVKISRLWESDTYRFEQIKRDFDYLFLLGISPSDVHIWIVSMAAHYENFEVQHSPDSRWVSVDMKKNSEWPDYIKDNGGKLEDTTVNKIIQQLKKQDKKQ